MGFSLFKNENRTITQFHKHVIFLICLSLRDVVLKLLQFEASTNVSDSKGCFPLHLAAWRGDVDIVQILIHHGPSHSRVNEQVLYTDLIFVSSLLSVLSA